MASPGGLTNDAIFEILTRASLETVGRCRLVSRGWNEITYEPRFRDLHSARTGTVTGFFVQGSGCDGDSCSFVPLDGHSPVLSHSCVPGPAKIVACHCGIVLCTKGRAERRPHVPQYYVCKPSTGEWTKIPNPRTRHWTLGTAMEVVRSKPSLRYKVLRVSDPGCKNHRVLFCEIFNSDVGKWKRLPDVTNPPHRHVFALEDPVVVRGTAFWLEDDTCSIFLFEMYEETWDKFQVTNPGLDIERLGGCPRPWLVNHEGKLGLLWPGYDSKFIDLWVMEDHRTRAWKCTRRISTEQIGWPVISTLALCGTNVALLQGFYQVVLCRFPPPSVNVYKTKHVCGSQVFSYCSDLEPVNLPDFGKWGGGSIPKELVSGTRNCTE